MRHTASERGLEAREAGGGPGGGSRVRVHVRVYVRVRVHVRARARVRRGRVCVGVRASLARAGGALLLFAFEEAAA